MLQRITKTEAAANGSAMEPETISKNGASLKSLMSKRNFLLALVAMLFLFSMNGYAQFSGGNGDLGTPYLISSKADMESLATQVNNGASFTGKYFLLTQDLKLFNTLTTVIGTASARSFNGIFDGGGHEIVMSLNTTGIVGVFGYIDNATIRNLTISGSITTTTTGTNYAGGICGYAKNSTINNCSNTGTITASSSHSGGICGYSTNTTFSDCNNTGKVSATSTVTPYSGGICGQSAGNLTNCYNTGNISVSITSSVAYSGGICGQSVGNLTNCYNTGSISATATSSASYSPYSGGICGYSTGNLSNCYNTGNISAIATDSNSSNYPRSGGICGYSAGNLSNCYNTGSVSASSNNYSCSGGIFGSASNGTLSNCYNTGNVSSKQYSGGICGFGSTIRIENSFAANLTNAGRILGNGTNATIANCYALSSMLINNAPAYTQNTAIEKNGQDIMGMASFQSQSWISSYLSWNFVNIWAMSELSSDNKGLPILKYQQPVQQYTISVSTGANGTISPATNQTVAEGANLTFTFTPNYGYAIDKVLIDGLNNAAAVSAGSYTFKNVTGNHSISVTFKSQLEAQIAELEEQLAAANATIAALQLQLLECLEGNNSISTLNAGSLQLYPNPAQNELRIESGGLKIESIEIFDVTGKSVILLFNYSALDVIDISALPNGIYFVWIYADGIPVIRKIIVWK